MKSANSVLFLTVAALALLPPSAFPETDGPAFRVADLRSFFHGDPPPPPKALPPKQLAAVSTAQGQTADVQVESFLRALADAIKARDGKALLPRLSDKYTIDDLPGDRKAADFLLQAIEQIAGPNEIVIISLENQNGIRTAKTEFRYSAEKVKPKIFQFDTAGKLLRSDLFKLQSRTAGA